MQLPLMPFIRLLRGERASTQRSEDSSKQRIDRSTEIIPFEVWVAASFCSIILLAIIFELPAEFVVTVFVVGSATALLEM